MTLDFKPEGLADCFKTGDMWGQVLVIKKLGSELTDQALSDITELPIPLNVTWFAQPMDKAAAVAFTRQRLAWIDKEIIEEQRSAVQKRPCKGLSRICWADPDPNQTRVQGDFRFGLLFYREIGRGGGGERLRVR